MAAPRPETRWTWIHVIALIAALVAGGIGVLFAFIVASGALTVATLPNNQAVTFTLLLLGVVAAGLAGIFFALARLDRNIRRLAMSAGVEV